MTISELRTLIEHHPDRGTIPVELVLAMCMKESSFREYAIKPELHYRYLVGKPDELSIAERLGQQHSWGLMQVMGAVARELGFKGAFHELWNPSVGLQYGLLKLHALRKKYDTWPAVISAYNAGHVELVNGKYKNQAGYVDPVLKYWNEYEHQIPLKSIEV